MLSVLLFWGLSVSHWNFRSYFPSSVAVSKKSGSYVGSSVCRCLLIQCQSLWSRKVGLNLVRVCVSGSTTKPDRFTQSHRSNLVQVNSGKGAGLLSENTYWPSLRNLPDWSTHILQCTWRVCHGLGWTYVSFMVSVEEMNDKVLSIRHSNMSTLIMTLS